MAEIRITDLPDAGDIQAGDTIPIVRGGTTQKVVSNPSVSVASMSGRTGQIIVVNPAEDGFDFDTLPPPSVDTQQISQTWNRGGNTAANAMLRIGDNDGMVLAYAVTLSDMAILRTDVDAATLEVMVDGVPVHELATAALVVTQNGIGVAIAGGTVLEIRNKAGGNTVSNCSVTLTFVRT